MSAILKKFILSIKVFLKKYFYYDSELTKDIFFILRKLNLEKPIFIDVGAYKGLWISKYLKKIPKIKAYMLEPHKPSFIQLKKKFGTFKNVSIFRYGLSDITGIKDVNVNIQTYTNSFLDLDPEASKSWKSTKFEHLYKESVQIYSLEDFAKNNNIEKINVLKLDVQGLEFKVLEGSKKLLKKGLIDVLVLEMIVAPTYKNQSKISDIFQLLENNDYKLYGIYDIEKKPRREKIQQFDVIFYNSELKL